MSLTFYWKVLKNDLSKKSLVLTAKRSLVNTQLPLLTDLSQLEAGLQTEGYVIKTYSKGVLVGFYANVKVRFNLFLGTWTV